MALRYDSLGASLVTTPDAGLVARNRVAVPAGRDVTDTAGVLQLGGGASAPVRIVPARTDLPAHTVVVSGWLAEQLRLGPGDAWSLHASHAVEPAAVELEVPAAHSLDEAARLVETDPLLRGHVFVHGLHTGQEEWIDLGGTLFRVRSATDPGGNRLTGLLRIGAGTRLGLFAPGARGGVDIVVLADCSASMSWNDIPASDAGSWRRFRSTMTRMDAQKQALRAMVDARARATGGSARLALMTFTRTTRTLFPASGGMAEVATPSALHRLREAVSILRWEDNSGTDIGQALHHAGELLHRHGLPDNDRLIVLLSDGAHWDRVTDERSGETVAGVEDPVALMEDLGANLGVRLHAIGISDPATFHDWWRREHGHKQPDVSVVPNHELLTALMQVSGGDAARIGGLDVLQRYFAELGAGVTRAVGPPAPTVLPQLRLAADVLSGPAARPPGAGTHPEWQQAGEEFLGAYSRVCATAQARMGSPLFRGSYPDEHSRFLRPAHSRTEFVGWIGTTNGFLSERLPERLRRRDPDRLRSALDGRLADVLWADQWMCLHRLRNYYVHDGTGEARAKDNIAAGKIIERHTGLVAPADDDAPRWNRLQLGLVRTLTQVLREVHAILEPEEAPEPAERSAAQPGGAGGAGGPGGSGGVQLVAQGFD